MKKTLHESIEKKLGMSIEDYCKVLEDVSKRSLTEDQNVDELKPLETLTIEELRYMGRYTTENNL